MSAALKSTINYKTPAQRRACCNCGHANLPPIGRSDWRCWLNHFDTPSLAVCDQHKFRGATQLNTVKMGVQA